MIAFDIEDGAVITNIVIEGCRDLKVMDINHDKTAEMVVIGVDSTGHSTVNVITLSSGVLATIPLPDGGGTAVLSK